MLNTGRVRDHWHTMTRTGKSQRLSAHRAVPFVEVHPDDAAAFGLTDGGIARLATEHGEAELEVTVTDTVVPGNLFMPMHWGGAFASKARVGALVRGMPDPVSGQPELKATPALIAPIAYRARGFLLSRAQVALPEGWWWARAAITGGWGVQFATQDSSRAVAMMVRGLIQSEALRGCELAEYADHARDRYRCAVYDGTRLVASLAYAPCRCASRLGGRQGPVRRRGARDARAPRAALRAGRHGFGGPGGLRLSRRRRRRDRRHHRGGRRIGWGGGRRLQGRNELRLLHTGDPQDAGRADRPRRVII